MPEEESQPNLNKIDAELLQNIREMERLAQFYHMRGKFEQAQEISDVIDGMKSRLPDLHRGN